jgi:hypothetical protein
LAIWNLEAMMAFRFRFVVASPYQVGERVSLYLYYHLTSVCLYRDSLIPSLKPKKLSRTIVRAQEQKLFCRGGAEIIFQQLPAKYW